jgi:hypothetical protein
MANLCNNFLVVHGQDSELDAVAEIFKAHKERRDTGLETEPPRWEIDSIERDDIIRSEEHTSELQSLRLY